MLNWIIWIIGLAIIGYVAWKWVIPFIKANPRKPFSVPQSRPVPPKPEEPEVPDAPPSKPSRKHEQ